MKNTNGRLLLAILPFMGVQAMAAVVAVDLKAPTVVPVAPIRTLETSVIASPAAQLPFPVVFAADQTGPGAPSAAEREQPKTSYAAAGALSRTDAKSFSAQASSFYDHQISKSADSPSVAVAETASVALAKSGLSRFVPRPSFAAKAVVGTLAAGAIADAGAAARSVHGPDGTIGGVVAATALFMGLSLALPLFVRVRAAKKSGDTVLSAVGAACRGYACVMAGSLTIPFLLTLLESVDSAPLGIVTAILMGGFVGFATIWASRKLDDI